MTATSRGALQLIRGGREEAGRSALRELYQKYGGSSRFTSFTQQQLNFALGANGWGTSFVVGAGTVFPHCMQSEIANLAGSLTGRGAPWIRGTVCGLMTALGGLGHTLPYLIPHFLTATVVSIIVVVIELAIISWIRMRFMDTPFLRAAFQVVVGGTLVFVAGILIGSS